MSSIFDLKLKAEERVVKSKKIKKILTALFNPNDHTKKLETQLAKEYLSSYGGFYGKLIRDDVSFLREAESMNLKSSLDPVNNPADQQVLIKALSLYPGDILPNDKELMSIATSISCRIKSSLGIIPDEMKNKLSLQNGKKEHVVKSLIVYLYENIEGRFPGRQDFITLISEISPSWAEELEDYSFSRVDLLVLKTPTVTEAEVIRDIEDRLQTLANQGKVMIHPSSLFKLNLFPEIKKTFFDNLNECKEIYQDLSGDVLELSLKSVGEVKSSSRTQILDEIFSEHPFSERFKSIIYKEHSSKDFAVYFSVNSHSGKLLFSENFVEEFKTFVLISKQKYNAQVFKFSTRLFNEEAITIEYGLNHSVKDLTEKDYSFILD